jgi:hypothetical protein
LLLPFLASLSQKDLRDTPKAYLLDHLPDTYPVKAGVPAELIAPYILSPRIGTEKITPWRSFALRQLTANAIQAAQENIQYVIEFVKQHVKLNETDNYYNTRLTPRGAFELGMADAASRNIFFVACCRSVGIPARLEPATSIPQYWEAGKWIEVSFETSEEKTIRRVPLVLSSDSVNLLTAGYYAHYTLAKYSDGDFHTLDLENLSLPNTVELAEGYYRLTAGSRANDGSVSVHTEYFTLAAGDHPTTPQTLTVTLPAVSGKLLVQGIIDMNTIVSSANETKATLKELAQGKGLLLCFIDSTQEPSKHILQELPAAQKALDDWQGGVLLTTAIANPALLQAALSTLHIEQQELPLTLYLNTSGGILYSSAGYRIGTFEAVLKTINEERLICAP